MDVCRCCRSDLIGGCGILVLCGFLCDRDDGVSVFSVVGDDDDDGDGDNGGDDDGGGGGDEEVVVHLSLSCLVASICARAKVDDVASVDASAVSSSSS